MNFPKPKIPGRDKSTSIFTIHGTKLSKFLSEEMYVALMLLHRWKMENSRPQQYHFLLYGCFMLITQTSKIVSTSHFSQYYFSKFAWYKKFDSSSSSRPILQRDTTKQKNVYIGYHLMFPQSKVNLICERHLLEMIEYPHRSHFNGKGEEDWNEEIFPLLLSKEQGHR